MSVDDFRGIAISPVISKVFEHCIDRFEPFFATALITSLVFKRGLVARMQSILFGILLIALSLVAVQLIYVQ